MVKVALLIGVSEYREGLKPLPAALKDVAAMQEVLQNREMGGFYEVKPLINPDRSRMEEEIEIWLKDRQPDDLLLLFFSGHGVKDESRELYFATYNTRKDQRGELIKSTAVPASFVRSCLKRCKSKRQVVILDCCFSGAFGDLSAKDDGDVDLESQLGTEGGVVLTSSSSLQYSFEQEGSDLSIYTRYLVEGIKTGAADQDGDGAVSVDELHQYATKKVQAAAPAMTPKIIVLKDEGFKIKLAKAPIKLAKAPEVQRQQQPTSKTPGNLLSSGLKRAFLVMAFGVSVRGSVAAALIVLVPLLFFVWGVFQILTAGDDQRKIAAGRKAIFNSCIAFLLWLLSQNVGWTGLLKVVAG